MRDPLVSVVVPTRDRCEQLARCLDALERQTLVESAEIIVVDDGSREPAALEAILADRPRAHFVRQPARGPAAARNTGVRSARATWVCFTDDDCEPRIDWIERLVSRLEAGAVAVAGRTVSGSPGNPFSEASELVAAALSTPLDEHPGGLAFAPSNNLGCRKDVLGAIPFDDRFPSAAGEDRDWCDRLIAAGHVLVREPRAVIVHRQQLVFVDFWRQQVRYGRGAYRFRARGGGSVRLEQPAFYLRLVRRAFRRGPSVGLSMCAAQVATAAGFGAEWAASRRTALDVVARRRAAQTQVSRDRHGDGGDTNQVVQDV